MLRRSRCARCASASRAWAEGASDSGDDPHGDRDHRNKGAVDLGVLESLPGVVECIPVSKPYKLVSRDAKEEDSILRIPTPLGDVIVAETSSAGGGPCAVESEEQAFAMLSVWPRAGCACFAAARTSRGLPVQFSGTGRAGAEDFGEGTREIWVWDCHRGHRQREFGFGRGIRGRDPDWRAEHAKFFAVEARGRAKKPVLLKRGCPRHWMNF